MISVFYVYPFRCKACRHRFRSMQWRIEYTRIELDRIAESKGWVKAAKNEIEDADVLLLAMTVLEALAILEAAVLECKKRDVDTPEVRAALDFLEPYIRPRVANPAVPRSRPGP